MHCAIETVHEAVNLYCRDVRASAQWYEKKGRLRLFWIESLAISTPFKKIERMNKRKTTEDLSRICGYGKTAEDFIEKADMGHCTNEKALLANTLTSLYQHDLLNPIFRVE